MKYCRLCKHRYEDWIDKELHKEECPKEVVTFDNACKYYLHSCEECPFTVSCEEL